MRIDVERFFANATNHPIAAFQAELEQAVNDHTRRHGRAEEWDNVIKALTAATLSRPPPSFDTDTVVVGEGNFESLLLELKPWRKGPIQIGTSFIDTEWRSDWKWQRVQSNISSLKGRNVLDIGCGNGYHLFRMLGDGAEFALGADPTILFNYQFAALQTQLPQNNAYLLPLRSEHLPAFECFDTVFSMGVLYHRREPEAHLEELKSFLRPGGELVLETLVVPGNADTVLVPEDRYASMANVWFVPSTMHLEERLRAGGWQNVRTVDVTITSFEEQRATRWMDFQSLADFLDKNDSSKTIEGYPAPTRAILLAEKPG